MPVLIEVIQRSLTRVKVLKVLSFGRQKSHLSMWHIQIFASSLCTSIRDPFWAGVAHADDSDEKRVQKWPKLAHLLNPAVWHIIRTRISWATIFEDQNVTDIVTVVNSDDPWCQSRPPLGAKLKYKREGIGLFTGNYDS